MERASLALEQLFLKKDQILHHCPKFDVIYPNLMNIEFVITVLP